MKSNNIMDAIGNISDRHIIECSTHAIDIPVRNNRKKLAVSPAMAACLSGIICIALVFAAYILPKNLGINKHPSDKSSVVSEITDADSSSKTDKYIKFHSVAGVSWGNYPPELDTNYSDYKTELTVYWDAYSLYLSSIPGIPVQLVSPGNDIKIETSNGEFIDWFVEGAPHKISYISAKDNKYPDVYFLSPILDGENDIPEIRITLLRDGNIIGAAKLQFTFRDDLSSNSMQGIYWLSLYEHIEFPPENGEYATVTQEQLDEFFSGNN